MPTCVRPVVREERGGRGEGARRLADAALQTLQRHDGLRANLGDEAKGHLLLRLALPDELGAPLGLLAYLWREGRVTCKWLR